MSFWKSSKCFWIFWRRIFYDPQGGHIVQYRSLRHPSPPKKVRRLLWTAPYILSSFSTLYWLEKKKSWKCSIQLYIVLFNIFLYFEIKYYYKKQLLIASYDASVHGSVFRTFFLISTREFESVVTSPGKFQHCVHTHL